MDVTDWLLDSDPGAALAGAARSHRRGADDVAPERARVATEGWGAGCSRCAPTTAGPAARASRPTSAGDFSQGQPWTSTFPTLRTAARASASTRRRRRAREGRARARQLHVGARRAGVLRRRGRAVHQRAHRRRSARYFGEDVDGIVARLLGEQLDDGGWNCEAENGSVRSSFDTTICVLDGLLAYERRPAARSRPSARATPRRASTSSTPRLMRRVSTGERGRPALPRVLLPDVVALRRAAGARLLPRRWRRARRTRREAIELVRSKQQADGRWLLDNTHRGDVHIEMEAATAPPSRWITLRALRVLRWADGAAATR